MRVLGLKKTSRAFWFPREGLPRNIAGWVTGPARTWMLLATAAVLPLLLFGGWAGSLSAEHTRANTRDLARDEVNLVAERISAELHAQLGLAQALASSTALDDLNLATFRTQAGRFEALNPLWQTVELSTPAGTQLLTLARPGAIPSVPLAASSAQTVLRTHKPTIGGTAPIVKASNVPLVTLDVPVMRQGEVCYILSVGMAPDSIGSILNSAGTPRDWIGVVVDATGHILARTRSEGEGVGSRASFTLMSAIAQRPADFHLGYTLEGLQVETVSRVLPDTGGWTVAFGIPAAALSRPVQRALLILAAACLVSLALSAALAVLVSRDMIQRRADERGRAERALQASEARRAMAIEAAGLGSWRWDIEQDRFDGSARCRSMLELPPAGRIGATDSWGSAMAAVNTDDRIALNEALQRCLTQSSNFSTEFRIQQLDDAQRWIHATGRILDGAKDQPRSLQGVMDDITSRKRSETERIELLRRLAMAQEDERRRISRDLHDQVGQSVTGLSLGLKALEGEGGISPSRVRSLQALVAEIGRDIHRAAADLRPSALDDLGLLRALQALAANCAETSGLRIDVQAAGSDGRLSSEIDTVIYRLVQEALTNILKHADASAVSVLLDRTADQIRVIVDDDGIGFNVDSSVNIGGAPQLGLSGMHERLALVGGRMTIESDAGRGTTIFIQVPIAWSKPGASS